MLQIEPSQTSQIAELLAGGAVLAVPTETVYGLAVLASSTEAIDKLIAIKDRAVGSGKLFTLVPESVEAAGNYAIFSPAAQQLADRHFPGPLTLILPKNPTFSHPYFDQVETIGLRIPDYPLFEELLPETGPLLLTSANRRGQPPLETPTEIVEVMPELGGIVLGTPGHQPPSTIIDCTGDTMRVVREGGVKVRF